MDNNIPIEQLTNTLDGLKDFIEDRNAILHAMWKEDSYNDFLYTEKLQDLDDVGGLHVDPISRKGFDLSPINDLTPNIMFKTPSDPKPVPFAKGGIVGTSPIIDMVPSGDGSFIMPSQNMDNDRISLEDSGMDGALTKATSSAIVEDFNVSDKLKKAFGESLALPSQASAVALADLMSKVPSGDGERGALVKRTNVNKITKAYNLPAMDTQDPAGDGGGEDDEEEVEIKKKKQKGLWELLVNYGISKFSKNNRPADHRRMLPPGGTSPTKGLLPAAKGDGLWTGQHLGGYGGGLSNFMGDGPSSISQRKKVSGRFDLQTGTPYINNKPVSIEEYNKFINLSKQEKLAQYGILTSLKSGDKELLEPSTTEKSNMAAVKEPVNKTDLNQLTETVIQENNTSIAEQTDPVRIKEKIAPVTPIPTMEANPSKPSPQDLGSHDAVPKIKLSPYFVEYTKTSSY